MTIVSIRGTHGSGKSTIVTKIMTKYGARGDWPPGRILKKPEGYTVQLPTGKLYIVGPYETPCGGCDAVQPYSLILPRIQAAVERGEHVLFEGAMVSSSYGSIGHALNELLHADPIFAFLDTPLDLCLERIRLRRLAKGNTDPVNPKTTAVKFENVARTKLQMEKLGSRVQIIDIDHTHPVKNVLKLFGVKIAKEPV